MLCCGSGLLASRPTSNPPHQPFHQPFHPGQDRADLAEQLEKRPDAMWRTGTLWTFKNEAKASGAAGWRGVAWRRGFALAVPS